MWSIFPDGVTLGHTEIVAMYERMVEAISRVHPEARYAEIQVNEEEGSQPYFFVLELYDENKK